MCVVFALTAFVWNIFHELLLTCIEAHLAFHVMCLLLLSDFKQYWNVSTDFSKAPQYLISWMSVHMFWSCLCLDRHSKAGRCSFATSCCEYMEDRNSFLRHIPKLDDFASVWAKCKEQFPHETLRTASLFIQSWIRSFSKMCVIHSLWSEVVTVYQITSNCLQWLFCCSFMNIAFDSLKSQ
jgi:hypothetical protein